MGGTGTSVGVMRAGGALAGLALAAAVHGQTILYVDDDAPAGGDGTSWNKAYRDLQDALDTCRAKKLQGAIEVRVAEGVYLPDRGTRDRDSSFDVGITTTSMMSVSLAILGGFVGVVGPDPNKRRVEEHGTVLSGDLLGNDAAPWTNREDNARCVVRALAMNDALRLDGLVIQGGENELTYESGGGVVVLRWNSNAKTGPSLVDCVVKRNRSWGELAAGISSDLGAVALSRCAVESNVSLGNGYAGGVYLGGYGVSHLLSACTLIGNAGRNTGAVYISDQATMTRCIAADNYGSSNGGAVTGGRFDANNCLFVNNTSGWFGGAVFAYQYDAILLTNCTLVGNEAVFGGAVFMTDSSRVSNCVLWGNHASLGGDNIAIDASYVTIDHSVVEGGKDELYGFWRNLTWTGNSSTDPRFGDPSGADGDPTTWRDNNYRPVPVSPCIDAGDNSAYALSTIDLDGRNRRYNAPGGFSLVDIGCYEAQPAACESDFNLDGFVNGLDFDAFIAAFEAGKPSADIDWDGFITGVDFDLFVMRFQEGC